MSNTTTKLKIVRSCRVRFFWCGSLVTIYCSYEVIRQIKPECVALKNNVYVPKAGRNPWIEDKIYELSRNEKMQEHFPRTTLETLGV